MAAYSHFKFGQSIRNWFLNLPIDKKLRLLSRLFLAFLLIFISFSLIAIEAIASLHGNIQAEAIFSKNQKVALYELMMYARTKKPVYFERYQQSIQLPIIASGLRKALVSEEDQFSFEYLRGVQQSIAGSRATRVARMTPIVRLFRNTEVIQQSAVLWVEADAYLLELIALAMELKLLIENDQLTPQKRREILINIDATNSAIDYLESQYAVLSAKLTGAVNRYLLTALIYLTGIFLLVGALFTYLIEHRIRVGLKSLLQAGRQLLAGDLSTRLDVDGADEVGGLAFAFDKMSDSLLMARTSYSIQNEQLMNDYADLAREQNQNENFLAKMSYEVRTPMTSVLSVVELLNDSRLSHEQTQYVHNIRTSTEILLSVMDDIVDMTRMTSGELRLEQDTLEIYQWFEETCQLLVQAESEIEAGIVGELHPYLAPGLPFSVMGDKLRLAQMIRGFWVAILETEPHADIGIGLYPKETTLEYATLKFELLLVQPTADIESLLALFNSDASKEIFETQGGHGLGLALSKRLVRLMDGQYGAERLPHQGVRMWFSVKLQAPKLQEVGLGDGLRAIKVLYVGCEGVERWVARHYLNDWGVMLHEERSSAAAWTCLEDAVAAGTPYQLMILGTEIDGDDGLTLSRTVKISPRLSQVGAVIIGEVDPELAHESGISRSVLWPLRRREFFDALLEAAHLKQPMRASVDAGETLEYCFQGQVLLAEDNEVNSQVAVSMLNKLGFKVEVVGNGQLAVQSVQAGVYDLVLMDCQMPELDGHAATENIRRWEQGEDRARTLIIAMTAESGEDAKQRCLASGMDDYLIKPVKRHVLAELLSKWLPFKMSNASMDRSAQLTLVNSQVLDLETIHEWQKMMPEQFPKMVHDYLQGTSEVLDQLDDAFEHKNEQSLRAHAHRLKSSSAYLGVASLSQLGAQLERVSVVEAEPLIEQIEEAFVVAHSVLNNFAVDTAE